ncbi:hypothetical protein LCGC14_2794220, partial [marine sediment metagenome]
GSRRMDAAHADTLDSRRILLLLSFEG